MMEGVRTKRKWRTRNIEKSKYLHLISSIYLKIFAKAINKKNKNVKNYCIVIQNKTKHFQKNKMVSKIRKKFSALITFYSVF